MFRNSINNSDLPDTIYDIIWLNSVCITHANSVSCHI